GVAGQAVLAVCLQEHFAQVRFQAGQVEQVRLMAKGALAVVAPGLVVVALRRGGPVRGGAAGRSPRLPSW
ncbi:hypothetical protein, partial [Streptomyces sp. NPDC056160]|uniref:hypothetical protein n=1 Tax=Streptomyces sp. NPDC056160 TaxID=3345731 RepID=UPI0035DE44F6